MPRKTYRKRKFSRRRRYSRSKSSVKAIVRRELTRNLERKYRQYTYTAVGASLTGGGAQDFSSISYGSSAIVASLCGGIANGTGEGQRVGTQITLKGVQINFALQPGDNTNYLRFLLVSPRKKTDQSSVTAFVQQLLSNTSSGLTQWAAPHAKDTFNIYMDKHFFLRYAPVDGNSAATIPMTRFLNKFIKFNKRISWDVAAAVNPNSDVFLVAISDSGVAANPGAVAGFVKLWYQDG